MRGNGPHNEFAPIAEAMHRLLERMGWLVRTWTATIPAVRCRSCSQRRKSRRAAATWGEPPAGDVIVLDGGLRVAFGRNALVRGRAQLRPYRFRQAGRREPRPRPGPSTLRAARNPGTRSHAGAPPDPGISRFVISLLTGHAQLPRPNASAIRAAGTGSTKPRAARNTNSAASAVSREAVRGGAVPPPETVVFDIDEQVEHGVHRQPGQRGADTERVDVHRREHVRARVVEVRRCGQSALPGRRRRSTRSATPQTADAHGRTASRRRHSRWPSPTGPEFPEISRQNFRNPTPSGSALPLRYPPTCPARTTTGSRHGYAHTPGSAAAGS